MNINAIAAAIGNVTVSRSRTVNLGNYENEQVFVSVTVPVASGQDYNSVYEEAMSFVEERLSEEVQKLGDKSINKVAKNRVASESKSEEKVEQKTETKPTQKTESKKEESISDVRSALKSIKDEFGNDAYKSILSGFGYKAVSSIEEEQHNAIIEACDAYRSEQADVPSDEDEGLDEDVGLDEDEGLDDEQETAVTEEDVKNALKQYNAENGTGAHKEILAKFNVTKVSDLKASQYAKVIAECI